MFLLRKLRMAWASFLDNLDAAASMGRVPDAYDGK